MPFLPSFSTVQWLTYAAVVLFLLGFGAVCAFGIGRAMLWLFTLSGRLLSRLWAYLWAQPLTSHGTAKFADARDVEQAGFYTDPEHLPLAQFEGRTLYEPVGGSVALIAPPRSRKSWGVLMPCIRHFNGSVIIHDPRSELYEHTHAERELYGPVIRFDPTKKLSAALDPLALIRWRQDEQHGDLQRVSLALLSPEPGATWSEYALEAVPLLAALLIERYEAGVQGLGAVVRCLVDPATTLKAKFEALLKHPHPTVAQAARRMTDKSEARQAAVVQALLSSLNVFTDPLVDANTSHNDLDLTELQHGAQPATVYWCSEFSESRRLRPLFGCLLEQLCARLGAPGDKRHKVLLALDEAMALGYSPELEGGMSHFSGDGIQVLLAFQNAAQVLRVYGPHTPVLHSIPTSVYFVPVATDLITRNEISEILGVTTTEYATRSQRLSAWGLFQSETLGSQRLERRLMTSDEVAQMDEENAIVVTKAHPPVMARKLDAPPVQVLTLPQQYKRPLVALGTAACLLGAFGLSYWTMDHVGLRTTTGTTTPPALSLTSELGGTDAPSASGMTADLTPDAPTPDRLARWFEGPQAITSVAPLTQPWRLMVTQGSLSEKALHVTHEAGLGQGWIESRFASEADCQASLQGQTERKLSVVRQEVAANPQHHRFITMLHERAGSVQWQQGVQMGKRPMGQAFHVFCSRVVEAE